MSVCMAEHFPDADATMRARTHAIGFVLLKEAMASGPRSGTKSSENAARIRAQAAAGSVLHRITARHYVGALLHRDTIQT